LDPKEFMDETRSNMIYSIDLATTNEIDSFENITNDYFKH
jgi:hypothetical protein